MLQEEEGLAWGAGLGVASAGVTFAVVVSMEFPASSGAGEEGFCVKYELEVGQVDGIVVGVAVTVGGGGVPGTAAVVPAPSQAQANIFTPHRCPVLGCRIIFVLIPHLPQGPARRTPVQCGRGAGPDGRGGAEGRAGGAHRGGGGGAGGIQGEEYV